MPPDRDESCSHGRCDHGCHRHGYYHRGSPYISPPWIMASLVTVDPATMDLATWIQPPPWLSSQPAIREGKTWRSAHGWVSRCVHGSVKTPSRSTQCGEERCGEDWWRSGGVEARRLRVSWWGRRDGIGCVRWLGEKKR